MRANVPDFEILDPQTFQEALSLIDQNPEWQPIAGGTDIMVKFESGQLKHNRFINLWGLKELEGISVSDKSIRIGALTTYSQIAKNKVIQKEFPNLVEAARLTGAIAIQNRGTIGGNIVNASPAADSPPALLAYDADIELVSKDGSRQIPLSAFFKDYKKMDLRLTELLKEIHLPRKQWQKHFYRKVGTRKAQAISKVCLALTANFSDGKVSDFRLGVGSVAPVSLRCKKTEAALVGQALSVEVVNKALSVLDSEICPISDIRSESGYRKKVLLNCFSSALALLGDG